MFGEISETDEMELEIRDVLVIYYPGGCSLGADVFFLHLNSRELTIRRDSWEESVVFSIKELCRLACNRAKEKSDASSKSDEEDSESNLVSP